MRELIVFFFGAFAGVWAGMWLGILAFKWCIQDGGLRREHMEKLLRMWRGPAGERWGCNVDEPIGRRPPPPPAPPKAGAI